MKIQVKLIGVLIGFLLLGCHDDAGSPVGPDTGPVPTTLVQCYEPVRMDHGFELNIGPGEPHKVLDLEGMGTPSPGAKFWSLAYWFVSTDQHVADEECPARMAFFDAESVLFGMLTDAYAPQEDVSPHLWNATVLTANALMHDYGRDLDMAISLGDAADNGSNAEMTWFSKILDGPEQGFIRPDTGDLRIVNGRNLGARNLGSQEAYNPYDRPGYPNSNADFPASGLKTPTGEAVTCCGVVGNHDALNMGNFFVDDPRYERSPLNNFLFDGRVWVEGLSPFGYLRGLPTLMINTLDGSGTPPQAFYNMIGGPGMGGILSNPAALGLLMNVLTDGKDAVQDEIDPDFAFSQVIPDPFDPQASDMGVKIKADKSRAFIGMQGLMDLLRAGGHGFWPNEDECNVVFPDGRDPGMGYYTLDATTAQGVGLPLRLIFLNTDETPVTAEGGMSYVQWRWLECQVQRALSDGHLLVVASHHPENGLLAVEGGLDVCPVCFGPEQCEAALSNLFQSIPNVILHLVGHGHINRITPHPHAGNPARGYWEIQTSSTSYWPQQSRIVEIVIHENGVGEIWNTMVDHHPLSPSSDTNKLTEHARFLALNDPQLPMDDQGLPTGGGTPDDRNRVLRFQVPDDVMDRIRDLPASSEITSRDIFPGGTIP